MGFYFFNYQAFLWMLPAILFSAFAQIRVQIAFRKYSRVPNRRGLTGAQAAQLVAQYGGVHGLSVRPIGGSLTDYFDPRNNSISLSQDVYAGTSISAVGVAAHEAGHSIQTAKGYLPNRIRSAVVPATQIGSRWSLPLIFIGLMLPTQYNFVVYAGIVLFSAAVFFQFITLPVEFDASRRALRVLSETGLLSEEELPGARRVLGAAAMTYLAACFSALLQLLQLLLLAGARRGDDR